MNPHKTLFTSLTAAISSTLLAAWLPAQNPQTPDFPNWCPPRRNPDRLNRRIT